MPFDLGDPPDQPLVLRLPPAGRVVVQTMDAKGERLRAQFGGAVTLFILPDDRSGADQMDNRLYARFTGRDEDRHSFRWAALWPGQYRLEVLARGARSPLVTIPDIRVAKGERHEDPRLDGIDLRGKFRWVTVRVRGANGRLPEASHPVVLIDEQTAAREIQGFDAQEGSARILTSAPYLDLLVAAQGHEPKAVSGVRTDITVTLERFLEILVRIAGGVPRLPEGHTLQVSVSKQGTQRELRNIVSNGRSGGAFAWLQPTTIPQGFDASGKASLPVSGDGVYTVSLTVRHDASRRSAPIEGVQPAEFQVRVSGGPQTFEIRIPDAELANAIGRLARR